MNKLKFIMLNTLTGQAQEPTRAYSDDAGLDLYVSEFSVIPPHGFVDIPSGIAVEIPTEYWGLLTGRSSTLRKRGLLVNQGVIDPGYRGELFAGVWNLTDFEVTIEQGERLAQLILMPNITPQFELEQVEKLDLHERGTSGFGSSGW